MVRLVQRKLIIPRGDTGTISVPVLPSLNLGDAAVFTIFDPMKQQKVWQKTVYPQGETIDIILTHEDTVNFPVGKYVWDIKFYKNPVLIDDEVTGGEEVDSYYAAYTLPVCEIRQTGDALLTADDAPTSTLDVNSLNIIRGAVTEVHNGVNAAASSAESAAQSASEIKDLSVSVSALSSNAVPTAEYNSNTGILSLGIPRGIGIDRITLSSRQGNVDTYTIYYTNNLYNTFTVTNGVIPNFSVGSIEIGDEASATVTGTLENPVLNFILPIPTKLSDLNDDVSGIPNGIAQLDSNGRVPASQLPSYVDDVVEYDTRAAFPPVGESGKIYVDVRTNKTYRWGNSTYTVIGNSLSLGCTTNSAFRGDLGLQTYTHAVTNKGSEFANGLYKITTNSEGHVINATPVTLNDILNLGLIDYEHGITVTAANNSLRTQYASDARIKNGTNDFEVIVPRNQHKAVFYGLAKAAGYDEGKSEAINNNPLGPYSDEAKAAIKAMLGIEDNSPNFYADNDGTSFMIQYDTDGAMIFCSIDTNGDRHGISVYTDGAEVNGLSMPNAPNDATNKEYVDNKDKIIAVIEPTNVATRAYSTNDLFILYNELSHTAKLYKATKNIAIGDTLTFETGNTAQDNCIEVKISDVFVKKTDPHITDVQMDGSSLVVNGVAQIPNIIDDTAGTGDFNKTFSADKITTEIGQKYSKPSSGIPATDLEETYVKPTDYASATVGGTVKINGNGLGIKSSGIVGIIRGSEEEIAAGTNMTNPIVPYSQYQAVFYGLAKAAGYDEGNSAATTALGPYSSNAKTAIRRMIDAVGNTDYAKRDSFGLVKIGNGLSITNGTVAVQPAADNDIKTGEASFTPIAPSKEHMATFYGLARAANADEKNSTLPVGTYTANAKAAIKAMLGISGEAQEITVSGSTPTITAIQNARYICGTVDTLDFTPSATGICDVLFQSGSTPTVLTVPNTVKWPDWFDPTALEANKTYELNVLNGVYGEVGVWT